jgi:hypothetical protein
MKRMCQQCYLSTGKRVEATHVASSVGGLCWFECGAHSNRDNPTGVLRARQEAIADWFAAIGVSLEQLDDLIEDPEPTQRTPDITT